MHSPNNNELKDQKKQELTMEETNKQETWSTLLAKIGTNYAERVQKAQNEFMTHARKAAEVQKGAQPVAPANTWQAWTEYATDFTQRSVLFWDTLRERGNTYLEHVKAGTPPLLAFEWEMISDGRTFARPVNYALLRIIPPEGTHIDNRKRPFVIIDPRAGHGPGIGGFKKDSEVGAALQFGYPVYFVIFFPEPEPGQTILDVNRAERKFLETVIARHPESPKPVIYGNCQGGWASMLIAANDPDKVGVVVTTGAPMSYWSGSWSGGAGENPMRYSGGLLGGSWMSLLSSDLGNGKFDGAYLVQNFENLNPANTFWNKYYNVWKDIDTERERFLEFEKWWGGYFLMNEEEIRWIVENLFIGNKLARGEVKASPGTYIDLKAIRSPIVMFSSKGDNITPPQQAFNWVADAYSSTAEIKANGQVIVGLVHEDVGHLGIFVSGKVAQKEHAEIAEALDYIELLQPGLYLMEIEETQGAGKDRYVSSFREVTLEEMRTLNKLERRDEKPFELVNEISVINEKAYAIYARPFVKRFVTEKTAELGRNMHPLRVQRWLFSDLNPLMWPLTAAASAVRSDRKPVKQDNPYRKMEGAVSEMMTASLNLCRDLRDAAVEASFFQIFGSMLALGASGDVKPVIEPEVRVDPRELPYVKEALAAVDKGGYPEAVARIGSLTARYAAPIPLYTLEKASELVRSDEILSKLTANQIRRIKSDAGVLALLEPEATLRALPTLLTNAEDRKRTLELLDWGFSLQGITREQRDMMKRIKELLQDKAA
jgi:pimeloyl-ACP methyl ester carboxylesterase